MRFKNRKSGGGGRARRGFTLPEMIIATAVGSIVVIGGSSTMIMSMRISRSTQSQQWSIRNAKRAFEAINLEIRPAENDLRVYDAGGNLDPNGEGVEVRYHFETDAAQWSRSIRLTPGADGLFDTPWDNELIVRDDVGDERVICNWLSPVPGEPVFAWPGFTSPLDVRMRTGDPLPDPNASPTGPSAQEYSDARTGRGVQGVGINITVAPRNKSRL